MSRFKVGDRVKHKTLPIRGVVSEVPATIGDGPMPGMVRVNRFDPSLGGFDTIVNEDGLEEDPCETPLYPVSDEGRRRILREATEGKR